ncbi:hypothetical protein N2W54_004389 [Lotmaria passim]
MNGFLRGSAPLGAPSSSGNFSALCNRSAQLSQNASFANSSSPFQHSAGGSHPEPSPVLIPVSTAMTGESAPGIIEAEPAEPLTVATVNRFVRQLRQLEDMGLDKVSRQADRLATSGGGGGTHQQQRGDSSGQERPSTSEDDEDTDSEDLELYTTRTERNVRAYLSELNPDDFVHGTGPVPDIIDDTLEGERRRVKERIRALSAEELRATTLDLHMELLITLYDAVTLETNLTETDEDAAVLERAVGIRDENIALLKVQLSTIEDDNVDLHDAKREALRKLSEAKAEMALLSQRNAKLLKQLDLKEEEIQVSLTSSLNGSQRPSSMVAERKDVSTLTEVAATLGDACEPGVSAAAAAAHESSSSLGGGSKSAGVHHELEEAQEELRLARHTLYDTEMERIKLQEQLQELKEATMKTFDASNNANAEERRRDAAHEAALQSIKERCERSERHAAALESDLCQLREELRIVTARAKAAEEKATAAATVRTTPPAAPAQEEERVDVHVAPSSGATTPVRCSSSPVRPSESRGSSAEPTAAVDANTQATTEIAAGAAARLSLSQPRSVSMVAQMAVLQRQLARAQAEAARLDEELHREREITQRQSQSEKKLLENVSSLTRQLRAREALEREARLLRRNEASIARGDGENGGEGDHSSAAVSELRRGRLTAAGRSSRGDAAKHEGEPAAIAVAGDEEEDGTTGGATASGRREYRHTTPELGRRRDSIFAALRNIQKLNEERRHSMQDLTMSIPSSAQEPSPTPLTSVRPLREGAKQPHLVESVEEMKTILNKAKEEAMTLTAEDAVVAARPTPVASPENPATSVSSYRNSRLSLTSVVSPRGPRSGSAACDSSADCVRVGAASLQPAPGEEEDAPTFATPHRHGFMQEPVTSSVRGEDAPVHRRTESMAKPSTVRRPCPSTESAAFMLPETVTTQAPQHHISRGQSCVRGSSSARPAGIRSRSVGASAYRSSLPVPIPTIAAAASAISAAPMSPKTNLSTSNGNNNSNNSNGASTASPSPKGSTIVRGLAAAANGPVATPRKRTASRRIVTGREAKSTSTS